MASDRRPGDAGEADRPDPVELGVQLLERLEHAELSLAELMDRIETVSTQPATTRAIIEEAEKRGIIERDGHAVKPSSGRFLTFESEVVERPGDYECERCGKSLSVGHFIRLEAGELGPFGSSCIETVTGRRD
jgi:CRISPR/Cas system-associated protein Cas10 (large subunit of type III CRISPR-Cas system)